MDFAVIRAADCRPAGGEGSRATLRGSARSRPFSRIRNFSKDEETDARFSINSAHSGFRWSLMYLTITDSTNNPEKDIMH